MVTQHNTDHNIVKVNTLDSGTLPGLDAAESLNPQPSFSDESGTAHSTHCIMHWLKSGRLYVRLKHEDM